MKKAIIVVSAIAFLLSVNFAMARPPVPVRFPVDPTIQYILDWLEDLQIQVNEIELIPGPPGEQGPQGEQGEQGIQGPAGEDGMSLHLYDGNAQDLGVLISNYSINNNEKFTTYINFENNDAILKFDGGTSSYPPSVDSLTKGIWFSQPNCVGEPFISGEHLKNPVIYQNYETSNYYFRVRLDTGAARNAVSRIDSVAGCESWPNNFSISYLIEEVTLPFTTPLAWPFTVVKQ